MKKRNVLAAGLAIVMIVPVTASAQTLYKQVRPDGSIIYSDKPEPGARIVEERDLPPPPPPPAREQRRPPAAGGGAGEERRLPPPKAEAGKSAWDIAHAEVLAAQRALDEAKRLRDEGQAPLPGERIGTAGGGSRLSEAYDARLRSLDQAVTAAEERLRRAYEARNAAR